MSIQTFAMQENAILLGSQVWVAPADWQVQASRSGGAGGQHVNRTNSRVTLHLVIAHIQGLSPAARQRLISLAGDRCHSGVLVIHADEHREQPRNREALITRVRTLIAKALIPPKVRRPTRPSRGSQERRLNHKKQRGQTKLRRNQRFNRGDDP